MLVIEVAAVWVVVAVRNELGDLGDSGGVGGNDWRWMVEYGGRVTGTWLIEGLLVDGGLYVIPIALWRPVISFF